MKYPYIGKSEQGNDYLFISNKLIFSFISKSWLSEIFGFAPMKNITAEYLANTYGEVKSKWHAHFIVELGEGADYELCGSVSPNDAGQFIFDAEHKRLYFTVDNVKFAGMKQITIPLPPKCESVDEWPKVGSSVEWGHTGKGEVKYLSDGFAWIKLDNKDYTTVYVSSLRKPKTPEQELRDELISFFGKIGQNGIVLIGRYDEVADDFLSKYNITKKGEGDE